MRRLVLLVGALIAGASCQLLRPLDDLSEEFDVGAGTPLGGVCGANEECGSTYCAPERVCACPPDMVRVGPSNFCIDAEEVTTKEFARFFAASRNMYPMLLEGVPCGFKATGRPWMQGGFTDVDPAVNVDWCDAYAFCRAQNKRLCGGPRGGALDQREYATARLSQWHNACTRNGANVYPYGTMYMQLTCVSADGLMGSDLGRVQPVASARCMPGLTCCEGGYPGIYDLSGNAAEWEDACESTTGQLVLCRVRGGGARTRTGAGLRCAADEMLRRDTRRDDVGFRCCTR